MEKIESCRSGSKLFLPLLITAVFFCTLIFVAFYLHTIPIYNEIDDYYSMAQNFLDTGAFEDINHGPQYVLLTAGLGKLIGDTFISGKIVSLFFMTGLIFLTYLAGAKIFNRRVGLIAQIITATTGAIFFYGSLVLTDITFTFWAAAAIFTAEYQQKNKSVSLPSAALAGLCCGFAYLTRHTALFILPALFLPYLSLNLTQLKTRLRPLIVFVLVFCCMFILNVLFNRVYINTSLPDNNLANIALGVYGVYTDHLTLAELWHMTRQNPLPWVENFLSNLLGFCLLIIPLLGNPVWSVLAIIGFIKLSPRYPVISAAVICYVILHLILFGNLSRSYVMIIPFFTLLTIAWLERLPATSSPSKIKRLLRRPAVYVLVLALNLLFLWVVYLPLFTNIHHYEARALIARQNFSAAVRVASPIVEIKQMDVKNRFQFILWRPRSIIKEDFLKELEAALRSNKVDYLLVDDRNFNFEIKRYLFNNPPPAFLELAAAIDNPGRARLFKYIPPSQPTPQENRR